MGLSEQGRVCKKHHEEKHGVCASCLRDRLSQLNHLYSRDKAASSSSHSSASVSSSTSCRSDYESAETHNQGMLKETNEKKKKKNNNNNNKKKRVVRTHRRSASSNEIGSISFTAEAAVPAISGGGGIPNGLKKSRSVAASYSFAPQPARAMSYCVGDDDMGIKNTHHHQQYNLYNKGNNNNSKGSSEGCDNYGNEKKKKKGGFWSKLLHLKGKNNSNHREVMIQQRRVY